MQEVHHESLSSSTLKKILITTLSFGLMGSMSGVIAGVIDAMRSSGVYVLLSSTSLHLVGGCLIGLLIGCLYGLSPKSFGVQGMIDVIQNLILPPRQVSDYQRGRTVSSIWLWALVINVLIPLSAGLGISLTSQINTPLFSKIVSTALVVFTTCCAIPFVYSLSNSGGRLLEAQGSQIRHLTSHVPAAIHPILLVLSAVGVLGGLSIATPPIFALIKSFNEPMWAILSIAGLGVLIAGTLWGAGILLTGAKFKGTVSGALKLLRLGQNATNPLLHLTLAIIYSIYNFVMWILSSPPEWASMKLHHAVLVTLFFLPLMIGGEYLRPFIQYSRKTGVLALLVIISIVGTFGLQTGLAREKTRQALYTDTTSSAFILKQLRKFFDQDGDGVASALGEFDCDDQNPNAYPGAYDIPGNDIDEDCDGFDLSTAFLKSAPVAMKSAKKKNAKGLKVKEIKNNVKAARSLFDRIEGPHHLIWITIPGLTADVMMSTPAPVDQPDLSPKPALAPNLRAWANQGVWMTKAYAPTSDRTMSLFSLLTGRYPSELIRNTKTPPAFSKAMRTFPETLERSRYQNAAFVDDQSLDEAFGYSQGFKVWDNVALSKPTRRLRRNESPFIRLIEKVDVHLKELVLAKREYSFVWLHSDELVKSLKPVKVEMTQRSKTRLIKANRVSYQKAIQKLDRLIPQLRAMIEAKRSTFGAFTVIINGLHGVSFSEETPSNLNESWLQTTSLTLSSEIKAQKIDEPTRLLSVTSTLLDFAEIETFDPSRELMNIHDKGWVSWALGDPIGKRPIYAEFLGTKNNLSDRVWIKDGWKLKDQLKGPNKVINEHLYWLKNRGEDRDRKPTEETRFKVMRREMDRFEINTVRALPKLRR